MITLCTNCWCMTKTIKDDKCGKCKEYKYSYRKLLELVKEMMVENLDNDNIEWTAKFGSIRLSVAKDYLTKAERLLESYKQKI